MNITKENIKKLMEDNHNILYILCNNIVETPNGLRDNEKEIKLQI